MGKEANAQLWDDIMKGITDRLGVLREESFRGSLSFEFPASEETMVHGKKVIYSKFRGSLPGGETLVVVQAASPAFLGLGVRSAERGFVIDATGNVRDASEKELGYVV
jgi:hypothetical protein